jgi:hypothetical protein
MIKPTNLNPTNFSILTVWIHLLLHNITKIADN